MNWLKRKEVIVEVLKEVEKIVYIDKPVDVNLKPCPFCCDPVYIITRMAGGWNSDYSIYYISCFKCEQDHFPDKKLSKVIEQWNQRCEIKNESS